MVLLFIRFKQQRHTAKVSVNRIDSPLDEEKNGNLYF